jgi:hypothetical protein
MVHEVTLLNGRLKTEETPVTVTVWHLEGYKCTLHLMPITISHPSLLLALGFFSFLLSANHQWRTKKCIKRERSPSAEGSHLPDDAKTPPPMLSRSPPPPRSPSEVSSRHHYSPVFEQGSASGTIPVSGPSLLVVDTSRDEEFARKLFGDLNSDILGPPGDGKIIIIDDSDDDDEAQEEGTTGFEPMTIPGSTVDAPVGARVANSDNQGSDQEADGDDNSGRSTGESYALRMHNSAFSLFLLYPL